MKQIVAWAVKRPTIVNLVMVGVALASLFAIQQLPKETFPELTMDEVRVEVLYPGGSPKEIESGILLKVEDAVQGVTGIEKVTSEAKEGRGFVRLELRRGAKVSKVLRDVKDQVERIATFPKDAEKARVYALTRKKPVLQFALYGDVSRSALQTLAERYKDQLLNDPAIKQVEVGGTRSREISIELREDNLRQYNLQIRDVTAALQKANFDMSGGTIRGKKEEFRIRVYGKQYYARQLTSLIIRTLPGGTPIRLRDVATVREAFQDTPKAAFFNGKRAVFLNVQSMSQDNILTVAAAAKKWKQSVVSALPVGVKIAVYQDATPALRSRISLLVSNGLQGLILVLLVLSFFMNVRLAFWVASGLLLSIMGAYIVAWQFGWSINMISLFGIILVVGILVDDAIVVAENIYAHLERGASPVRAAIDGTAEVLPAVLTAVVTTCLTFVPLFYMGGFIGKFIYMIPAMVIAALLCSLVESLLILPPHLAHSLKPRNSATYTASRFRGAIDGVMTFLRETLYARSLRTVLQYRWVALSGLIGMLLLSFGLVGGGLVKFVFFPAIEGDRIVARFTMKPGTPATVTRQVAKRIEAAARGIDRQRTDRKQKPVIVSTLRWIGVQTGSLSASTGSEVGEVQLELVPSESRKLTSSQMLALWRKRVGSIPDSIQLTFASLDTPPLGRPLEFQLTSQDPQQLARASAYLKRQLGQFPGVYGADDDLKPGKRELQMKLTPLAESLGFSLQSVANQVRYRLYGQEVMRLQRGVDEVRIVVRYPDASRDSVKRLSEMWVQDQKGKKHPLAQLVTWTWSRDVNVIRRVNRKRQATVFAQLDESQNNRQTILGALRKNEFKKLATIAPMVRFEVAGQGREQAKVLSGMLVSLPIAMFAIFFTLVLIFRSYSKVLIVMAMIPFGVIGAILGHWVLGVPLTILSFFGIVGVSGVVVNDSIVLMDAINRHVAQEDSLLEAVWLAGQSRLRAILSTTLTTVVGLLPLLLERSLQAQFLIPMAISLAAGVLFATFLTLYVVPSLYLARNDLKRVVVWLRTGEWLTLDEMEALDTKKHEEHDDQEQQDPSSTQPGLRDAALPA